MAQVTENKDYGPRPKYRKQSTMPGELSRLNLLTTPRAERG